MPQDLPNTYRHPLPNGLYYDMVRVRSGVFVMNRVVKHHTALKTQIARSRIPFPGGTGCF